MGSGKTSDIIIDLKPIYPDRMRPDPYTSIVISELKKEVAYLTVMMERPALTWKAKDRPEFTKRIFVRGNDLVGETGTNSTPYVYLALGTNLRWRALSKGYIPKTKVRSLRSGRGFGYATGFLFRPVPGIQARKWGDVVAEKRQAPFEIRMNRAFERASKRLFDYKKPRSR